MKKLLTIAALSLFIATPALAESAPAKPVPVKSEITKDEKPNFRKMSKEQKQKFFAEKEAAWAKMSREEKLAELNKRHEERAAKMQANWAKMSDDEKLEQHDKRIAYAKKRHERKEKMKAGCK
jgi:hypothetical protein